MHIRHMQESKSRYSDRRWLCFLLCFMTKLQVIESSNLHSLPSRFLQGELVGMSLVFGSGLLHIDGCVLQSEEPHCKPGRLSRKRGEVKTAVPAASWQGLRTKGVNKAGKTASLAKAASQASTPGQQRKSATSGRLILIQNNGTSLCIITNELHIGGEALMEYEQESLQDRRLLGWGDTVNLTALKNTGAEGRKVKRPAVAARKARMLGTAIPAAAQKKHKKGNKHA